MSTGAAAETFRRHVGNYTAPRGSDALVAPPPTIELWTKCEGNAYRAGPYYIEPAGNHGHADNYVYAFIQLEFDALWLGRYTSHQAAIDACHIAAIVLTGLRRINDED